MNADAVGNGYIETHAADLWCHRISSHGFYMALRAANCITSDGNCHYRVHAAARIQRITEAPESIVEQQEDVHAHTGIDADERPQ
jgi:hypothetical protein